MIPIWFWLLCLSLIYLFVFPVWRFLGSFYPCCLEISWYVFVLILFHLTHWVFGGSLLMEIRVHQFWEFLCVVFQCFPVFSLFFLNLLDWAIIYFFFFFYSFLECPVFLSWAQFFNLRMLAFWCVVLCPALSLPSIPSLFHPVWFPFLCLKHLSNVLWCLVVFDM